MTLATLFLLGIGSTPPVTIIEHSEIELKVETADGRTTSFMDQTPPPNGKNPRPVAKAKVGELVHAQYLMTNIYPHKTIKDVVVHFFVAPIDAVGQSELPNLAEKEDVVLETAFDMDFRPGGHAGARASFRISEPGVYLIRVESRNTESDHEHFAAIDLVVGGE